MNTHTVTTINTTTPNYTARRIMVAALALFLVPATIYLGLELFEVIVRAYCHFALAEGTFFRNIGDSFHNHN